MEDPLCVGASLIADPLCVGNHYITTYPTPPIYFQLLWGGIIEGTVISETRETTPTKIGVHACYINLYLHEFFESIPID